MKKQSLIITLFTLLLIPSSASAGWILNQEDGPVSSDEYAIPAPDKSFKEARQALKEGNYRSAANTFERLAVHADNQELARKSRLWHAESTYKAGKYLEALKAYRKFTNQYPKSSKSKHVLKRQMDIGFQLMKGNDAHELLGVSVYPATSTGENVVRTILSNYPYQSYSDQYQYKFANHFFNNGEYEKAVQEYQLFLENYEDSKWAENAQYLLGVSHFKSIEELSYDTQALQKAKNAFNTYLEQYPEGKLVKETKNMLSRIDNQNARKKFKVADWYERTGKKSSCIYYFQSIIKNYPKSIWAQKASKRLKALDADLPSKVSEQQNNKNKEQKDRKNVPDQEISSREISN